MKANVMSFKANFKSELDLKQAISELFGAQVLV